MNTDLIQIETLKPADVFKPGAVERLILDVEQKVRATIIDASTPGGRKEATSLAFKVTRSKTALDEMGKTFVADLKKAAGVVDADRRIIRDRFDALRDEVRKPVDEYEAAEDARRKGHTDALMRLNTLAQFNALPTVAEVSARHDAAIAICIRDWEEFAQQAEAMAESVRDILDRAGKEAAAREAERAELERLRKAEAERVAAERKAQAEQARIDRDREISERAQRETEERNAAVALAKERERFAAVARAEKAERDAVAAAERAEFEKAAALEKAERDRLAAIETERKRAEAVKAQEEAEARRREADTEHRRTINCGAVADLMNFAGITKKAAQEVIAAIAGGKISNVKISY